MKRSPQRLFWRLFCLLAILFLSGSAARAQVVISEFMATNSNTIFADEDGSKSDWIELQNNGPTSVNLNGWYLTDDAKDLRKWQFPAVTPAVPLASGARLVVWASGKNRKTLITRLHTNFKLNGSGDYLALVRPDGLTREFEYSPAYPPQATDGSYGISGGRQWNVLAGPSVNTQWKVRVPQDAVEFAVTMAGWTNNTDTTPFASWVSKMTSVIGGVPKGLGYDAGGSTGGRAFLINYTGSPNGVVAAATDVGATGVGMYIAGTSTFVGVPSLCARTTFTVADPSTIQQLRLNIRYDDGFIVYLNGTEIARGNPPVPVAIGSGAPVDRVDSLSEDYETFTLAGAQAYLLTGTNVLAIQGFNYARTSAHFVITPSLEAFQSVSGAGAAALGYLLSPTPGTENTVATASIGPDISNTTKNPVQPVGGTGSAPLLITARARKTLNPIASVTCNYAVNFGSEVSLAMKDDGTGGDLLANDGIYSVQVPTTALAPGHMLRWRIVAIDSATVTSNDPPFLDPLNNEQYFGTMAQTPAVQSKLPLFYWFQNTPTTPYVFGTTKTGIRGSVYWIMPGETSGRFYDNVAFSLHGQSTASFAKKSQNVSFNNDNAFKWKLGEATAGSVNLLSNWADKSHVRNSMAWEIWNSTKHPSHWCQQVRVQQITAANLNSGVDAQFLGLWDMVEDANSTFFERWNKDPNGAMYKVYNSLQDVTQNSTTNGAGVEKKTREWEDFSDLAALETAMDTTKSVTARRQWLYDNVDVPGLINYLAVHNLNLNNDFGHKNYYIYRDTLGTGEWTLMPWDQDLSFGHTWTSAQNYFDDDIDSARGIFIGVAGSNRLMSIISTTGATELAQMYTRRMRSLMDQFYGAPATPNSLIASRMGAYLDAIDPPNWPVTTDAERDFQKWGFWVDGSGSVIAYTDPRAADHRVRPSALRITTSNNAPGVYPGADPYAAYGATAGVASSLPAFVPGRRTYLYTANPTINGQVIPAAQNTAPTLSLENANYNPGALGQDYEFFVIRNPSTSALDLSGWQITGAVQYTFRGGTVIAAQGTATSDGNSSGYVNQLIVARNPAKFRLRTNSPKAGEYRQVVGGYDGQLSARGALLELRNPLGVLIASYTYTGSTTPVQNALRVSELNYAPSAPTAAESTALPGVQASDFEYIELVNISTLTLTLSGSSFDKGITFTFPTPTTLGPGARTLLVSNQAAFTLRYGTGFTLGGQFEGNLDNSGETIELLDPVGEIVLSFKYDNNWFPPTDGGGYSLVMRAAKPSYLGYDVPSNWAISSQKGGVPGSAKTSFSQCFEGWRHSFFSLTEEAAPLYAGTSADADLDGRSNFAEYAFGQNPKLNAMQNAPQTSIVEVNGSHYMAISYVRPRLALDVGYAVEASNDMKIWTGVDLPVGTAQDLGDGTESVTYRDSVPDPIEPRFLRVRAVK